MNTLSIKNSNIQPLTGNYLLRIGDDNNQPLLDISLDPDAPGRVVTSIEPGNLIGQKITIHNVSTRYSISVNVGTYDTIKPIGASIYSWNGTVWSILSKYDTTDQTVADITLSLVQTLTADAALTLSVSTNQLIYARVVPDALDRTLTSIPAGGVIGQVLMLSNVSSYLLTVPSGMLPPNATVLLVWNGTAWVSMIAESTLSAAQTFAGNAALTIPTALHQSVMHVTVTPTTEFRTITDIPAGSFNGQTLIIHNNGAYRILLSGGTRFSAGTISAHRAQELIWSGTTWIAMLNSNVLYVEDFGATGEGVTVDDYAAIQACYDASDVGCEIKFRPRVYLLSAALLAYRYRTYTGANATGGTDQNSYPCRGTVLRAMPSFNAAGTEHDNDHLMIGESAWSVPIASITNIGTAATITTSVPHKFRSAPPIRVTGANGADAAIYNLTTTGVVTSPTTITYTLGSVPSGNATGTLVLRGSDWMHWTKISNISFSGNRANGAIAGGLKIFQMGEEFELRNCETDGCARGGYTFIGSHAVGLIQNISAWNSLDYGIKFIDNFGAVVRLWGMSGDGNSPAQIYCDGGRITCTGIKNEVRKNATDFGAIVIAGTTTGGNRAEVACDGGSYNPPSNGGTSTETGEGSCSVVTIPRWTWEFGVASSDTDTGAVVVTGTQTVFTNGRYVVGKYMRVGGQLLTISVITDDTHISATAGIVLAGITRSGTLATATSTNPHGLKTGDTPTIAGAVQSQYNGSYSITVTGAKTFTYTMGSDPGATATGTITLTNGVHSTNGVVESLCTTTPSVFIKAFGANGVAWTIWDRVNNKKTACVAGALDELVYCPDGSANLDISASTILIGTASLLFSSAPGGALTERHQYKDALGVTAGGAYQWNTITQFSSKLILWQVTNNNQIWASLDIQTVSNMNIYEIGGDATRKTLFRQTPVLFSALPVPGGVGSAPSIAADGARLYCSNGRKTAEGSGAGTGIMVQWNNATATWIRTSDFTTAVA